MAANVALPLVSLANRKGQPTTPLLLLSAELSSNKKLVVG